MNAQKDQLKDRRIRISQHSTPTRLPRHVAAPWGVVLDLWRAAAVTSGTGSVLIALSRSEPLILRRMGETSQA